MNKKTLNALHGSIEKWDKIIAGTENDRGRINCPLCQLFNYEHMEDELICIGCPVSKYSNEIECKKTPYSHWNNHNEEHHVLIQDPGISCPTCKELAQKELNFLKSLLPKDTK